MSSPSLEASKQPLRVLQEMGEGFTHCSYLWLVHAVPVCPEPQPFRTREGADPGASPPTDTPAALLQAFPQLPAWGLFWLNTQFPQASG